MTKIDARALKAKHRIELVMQEHGEQFEISGDRWRSKITPGLIVDIRQQIYEHQPPGIEKEPGDLYTWLMQHFGWSFQQAVRYLQNRPPDPTDAAQPTPAADATPENKTTPLQQLVWKFESEYPDTEKDASGLYERGIVDDGIRKPYHQYLLLPCDDLQKRALEIGGEKIRVCFTWHSWEIDSLKRSQPSQFTPVEDMEVEDCDECEKPIGWWWKQKPLYEYQESFTPGARSTAFKRTRIYDSHQVYAFKYELYEEPFFVCENCKRKMINYREALDLLYKSARRREALEQ